MAIESHRRNSNVGTLVREARESAGLTRQALAATVGVSVSTIDRVELNDSLPKFGATTRICRCIGLSLDALGQVVEPEAPPT